MAGYNECGGCNDVEELVPVTPEIGDHMTYVFDTNDNCDANGVPMNDTGACVGPGCGYTTYDASGMPMNADGTPMTVNMDPAMAGTMTAATANMEHMDPPTANMPNKEA